MFSYFNSIKVRLELRIHSGNTSKDSTFQFHKGAIRTDNEDKPTTLMLEFQFHKGAIRTLISPDSRILCVFQFHKGAIRTLTVFPTDTIAIISIP